MDDWTFGTVLRNPGCRFVVMFIGRKKERPSDFHALVLDNDTGARSARDSHLYEAPEITVCGGRPSDRDPWIVIE
jgi:hypothetical protein